MTATHDHCRALDGHRLSVGDAVELQLPKHQLGVSPGHYMALSDVEDALQ